MPLLSAGAQLTISSIFSTSKFTLQMSTSLQAQLRTSKLSIFSNPEVNATKPFNGDVLRYNQWDTIMALRCKQLPHGSDMIKPNFQPKSVTPQQTSKILQLETDINNWSEPEDGTPEEKIARGRTHDRNLAQVQVMYNQVNQTKKDIEAMTISATTIVLYASATTDGKARSTVDTIVNNASMDILQKPKYIMMHCRDTHYPPGAATHAVAMIRRETEQIPPASSPQEIDLNAQALTRGNNQVNAIITELDSHYNPQIQTLANEISRNTSAIATLQQPPANLAPGVMFQVNQGQIANYERQIQHAQFEQNRLFGLRQRDQIFPLDPRALGMSLASSIPVISNDTRITSIKHAVEKLLHDDTIVHPWSSYEEAVAKIMRNQTVMHALSNSTAQDANSNTAINAYVAQDTPNANTDESAFASSQSRSFGPCYVHYTSSCPDGRNCRFDHDGPAGSCKPLEGLLIKYNRQREEIQELKQKLRALEGGKSPRRGRSPSPGQQPYSKSGSLSRSSPRSSRSPSPAENHTGNDRFRSRSNAYRAPSPFHG